MHAKGTRWRRRRGRQLRFEALQRRAMLAGDPIGLDLGSIVGEIPSALSASHARPESWVPSLAGDAVRDSFEPDDTFDAAVPLNAGDSSDLRSLHSARDVDWFTFTLDTASTVTIETNGTAGGDTFMELSGSNGFRLHNDDGGEGLYSQLVVQLEPATYWVMVRPARQSQGIDQYRLYTELIAAADSLEPDGRAELATPLPLDGTAIGHSIHHTSDEDWHTFTLARASRLILETHGDPDADTFMSLFRGNGAVDESNDDGVGKHARIEGEFESGTYTVRVTSHRKASVIAGYAITAQATSIEDRHEPDDTPQEANSLVLGGISTGHSIHLPSDQDWFTFSLSQAANVVFETTSDTAGDTYMELWSASRLIAADNDGGQGLNSRIAVGLAPGEYFVGVASRGQVTRISDYSLSSNVAVLADSFEPDNGFTDANELTLGVPVTGHNLHFGSDEDWFTFTVNELSKVTLETTGAAGDTIIELHNSGGQIAIDDDGGVGGFSKIDAYLAADRYWLRVTEDGRNRAVDGYSVVSTAIPVRELRDRFEPDDARSEATLLEPGDVSADHNIHFFGNSDWYAFTLTEPARVVLRTSGSLLDETRTTLWNETQQLAVVTNELRFGRATSSEMDIELEAGSYWVEVSEDGNDSTIDNYSLSYQSYRIDGFEPDNAAETATPIALGEVSAKHSFHTREDVDWFEFSLERAEQVTVRIDSGEQGPLRMGLYDGSGRSVRFANGSGQALELKSELQPGLYRISVSSGRDIFNPGAERQDYSLTLLGTEDPGVLRATAFTPTQSGFTVEFNRAFKDVLNLYDNETAGLGAADVVVRGQRTGTVAGSLVVGDDLQSLTFVKSGAPLPADDYLVTIRSAADAIRDTRGVLLDGDGDGVPGGDLHVEFSVSEAVANVVTISLADFVRGPGQAVQLGTEGGIPLIIDSAGGVRTVELEIVYDPETLRMSGATVADGIPAASVVINNEVPGLLRLAFFSAENLPAGRHAFVELAADVPPATSNSHYGLTRLIDVRSVVATNGNDVEFPVAADDAVHLVSYLGDVSGNGRINAGDASLIARVAAQLDTGFRVSLLADPRVVGDISGNGRLNSADASLVGRFAAGLDPDAIPALPSSNRLLGSAVMGPGLSGLLSIDKLMAELGQGDGDQVDWWNRSAILGYRNTSAAG